MNFSKWTGLGNDFVLLEPGESLDFGDGFEQRIIKLCDRRFGIGADGVVTVTPLESNPGVDFEMRIFNADGSEAAMCGNATRCVAKFIRNRGLAKPEQKVFNLHTKSGLVRPELLDDGRVCVDMGLPRKFLDSIKLTADCYDFTAETVSMGNPHAVIFVDDIEKIQLEAWGRVLECDRQFPDRCNIEFAQVVTPTQIRMRGLGTGLRRHDGLRNRKLRNPRCGPAHGPRGRRSRCRPGWRDAPYQARGERPCPHDRARSRSI